MKTIQLQINLNFIYMVCRYRQIDYTNNTLFLYSDGQLNDFVRLIISKLNGFLNYLVPTETRIKKMHNVLEQKKKTI